MINIPDEDKFEEWLLANNWGCDLYTFEKFSETTQNNIYKQYKIEML